MNIGIAITGSFCTYSNILEQIKVLVDKGHNVLPIVSKEVLSTDTRFGKAGEFLEKLENITNNKVIKNLE